MRRGDGPLRHATREQPLRPLTDGHELRPNEGLRASWPSPFEARERQRARRTPRVPAVREAFVYLRGPAFGLRRVPMSDEAIQVEEVPRPEVQEAPAPSARKRKPAKHVDPNRNAVPNPEPVALTERLTRFGAVPTNATHWRILKQDRNGRYEQMQRPSPDGSVMATEWPLDMLDVENVREWFGPGEYVVRWIGRAPRGGYRA